MGRVLASLTKLCVSLKLSADLPGQSLKRPCHALVWINWFKYVHCNRAVLKIHVLENLGNKCMQVSNQEQKAAAVLVLNCRGNCRQHVICSISENQNSQAHPSATINVLVMLFGFEQPNVFFF